MSLDVDDVMDEINGSQNILISSPISDTVSGLRNPITQYVIRQVLRKIGMSIYTMLNPPPLFKTVIFKVKCHKGYGRFGKGSHTIWNDPSLTVDIRLMFLFFRRTGILNESILKTRILTARGLQKMTSREFQKWSRVISNLVLKIRISKQHIIYRLLLRTCVGNYTTTSCTDFWTTSCMVSTTSCSYCVSIKVVS